MATVAAPGTSEKADNIMFILGELSRYSRKTLVNYWVFTHMQVVFLENHPKKSANQ